MEEQVAGGAQESQEPVPNSTQQEVPAHDAQAAADVVTREEVIVPYVRDKQTSECDFCGHARSQLFRFDIKEPVRSLSVCAAARCNSAFEKSFDRFAEDARRVRFSTVAHVVPSLFDYKRSWTIVRGNGDIDPGWRVARNWRSNPDMGMFYTQRGEPWWRIPLQKDSKVRLCLLADLRRLNADALAEDVWEMLTGGVLPNFADTDAEPSDEFLLHYPGKYFTSECPGDEALGAIMLH